MIFQEIRLLISLSPLLLPFAIVIFIHTELVRTENTLPDIERVVPHVASWPWLV